MNILNKIAIGSLRSNQFRTFTILGGIILATAMITVVLIIGGVFNGGITDQLNKTMGKWDFNIQDTPRQKVEEIIQEEVIGLGEYQQVGKLKDIDTPLYIGDSIFFKLEPRTVLEGRSPQKNGEIILPISLKKTGEIEIGANIQATEQGKPFKIVGFYGSREYVGNGEVAIAMGTIDQKEPINTLIQAKDKKGREQIKKALLEENIVYENNPRITFEEKGINYVQAVLILIIFIGAISQISNGFVLSLQGRRKEVGILRSTGMTNAQYKRTIYLEGFILGVVGVVIGLVIGFGGTEIFLTIFKESVEKMFVGETFSVDVTKSYTIRALLLTVFTVWMTITLSIFFPLRKTIKSNPIDLIKHVEGKKRKRKFPKKAKLRERNILWSLARKNYNLSRKKYRGIIFDLSITITMLIFIGYIFNGLSGGTQNIEEQYPKGVLSYSMGNIEAEEKGVEIFNHIEELKKIEGVKSVYPVNVLFAYLEVDKGGNADNEESYSDIPVNIVVIKEEELEEKDLERLGENKFLTSGETKERVLFWGEEKVENNVLKAGGTASGDIFIEKEGKEEILKGELVFSNSIPDIHHGIPRQGLDLFTTIEANPTLLNPKDSIGYFELILDTDGKEETYGNIAQYLSANGMEGGDLVKPREMIESLMAIIKILKILVLGFIYMIGLFGLLNIFNTISTNIFLREREFALLRTVGLSEKNLQKMLFYESGIIGIKSLVYGGGLGSLLILLGNRFVFSQNILLMYPWREVIILFAVVTITIFLTTIVSHRKIMEEDLLEVVREANM